LALGFALELRGIRLPQDSEQGEVVLLGGWFACWKSRAADPSVRTHRTLLFPCLQMRSTRKVSVWPVAFVGGLRYESPKVNAAGKVYGWKTVFDPHRPFAIDMAGFAVNLRLILQRSQAYFKLRGVKGGYQESSLLRELVTLNDLEPKAANCTKVRSLPRRWVVRIQSWEKAHSVTCPLRWKRTHPCGKGAGDGLLHIKTCGGQLSFVVAG